ncbi:polymorphic toxin type 15 domain-containing protein, partial [Microbacterium sp. ZW T5_56]|uniref:polymorphic toxin type 15 domain-containing protein n=1 Tax=Microbacterium sp. ZW T5_56 TaxID=3378081 RepID=UPI003854DAFE
GGGGSGGGGPGGGGGGGKPPYGDTPSSDLTPADRVRLHNELPDHLKNDPRYDPIHPHYDSLPHGPNGNIGPVNPDVPSNSGLTNSGRLIDPNEIPDELRPFIDAEPPTVVVRDGVLYLAEEVSVTFNRTQSTHDLQEMIRQIDVQQDSMKQLSFDEWTANLERYEIEKRLNTQVQYKDDWIQARADTLVGPGVSRADAVRAAEDEINGQVGIHSPDQYPGGNPNQIAGFGDSNINSSIGRQWQDRRDEMISDLRQALEDSGLPPELFGDVRLNVNFTVVDGPRR